MLHQDRDVVLTGEGQLPGEHLKHQHPQRIEVTTAIQALCLRLLGTHVLRSTTDNARISHSGGSGGAHLPVKELGRSKVEDFAEFVSIRILGDHDVLGLDVAVNDIVGVSLCQGMANVRGDVHGPLRPQ